MKKNNKGFTLIELLAVIIILAIIAIIAVPRVMSSLKTSKKNALITEARKVISATIEKVNSNSLEQGTNAKTTGCFTFSEIGIDGGGKYTGSVKVTATETTVYIWDGEYGFNGKKMDELQESVIVTTSPSNVVTCGEA